MYVYMTVYSSRKQNYGKILRLSHWQYKELGFLQRKGKNGYPFIGKSGRSVVLMCPKTARQTA